MIVNGYILYGKRERREMVDGTEEKQDAGYRG